MILRKEVTDEPPEESSMVHSIETFAALILAAQQPFQSPTGTTCTQSTNITARKHPTHQNE